MHKQYGKIPLKMQIPTDDELIEIALSEYVDEESGCWSFRLPSVDGYSKFAYKGKLYAAHRVFYTIFKADLDRGKVLDHLCRNRWCVNPEHLEEVSHVENIRRGVHANVSGEKNPKSSVSEADARKIIELTISGKNTREVIRLMPKVGRCAIYHIMGRRNWTHIWSEIESKISEDESGRD